MLSREALELKLAKKIEMNKACEAVISSQSVVIMELNEKIQELRDEVQLLNESITFYKNFI